MIEKPISIKKEEFSRRLQTVVAQSQLPPCVVADTLQLILFQVQTLANEQLQKDIEEYRKAVEEEKEGKNNDN